MLKMVGAVNGRLCDWRSNAPRKAFWDFSTAKMAGAVRFELTIF